jgi:hypothetical protein
MANITREMAGHAVGKGVQGNKVKAGCKPKTAEGRTQGWQQAVGTMGEGTTGSTRDAAVVGFKAGEWYMSLPLKAVPSC